MKSDTFKHRGNKVIHFFFTHVLMGMKHFIELDPHTTGGI